MYWNLLKAMKEESKTNVDLAKEIGKSRNTFNNKLKRKSLFNQEEMVKIKMALNTKLPLEKLFLWEEKKEMSSAPAKKTNSSQTDKVT